MTRTQNRVAVRPNTTRMLVLGFALAAASLMWGTVAGAQDTNAAANAIVESAEVAPTVLLTPSMVVRTSVANTDRPTTSAAPAGPMMASAAMSYVPSATRNAEMLDERRQDTRVGLGRNLALVIVGVAAMVIGSEVDDAPGALLVAGGAGMTLYGLYHILK